MTQPSERVHDTFRSRSAGNVRVPTNAKPLDDNFHVDRSRLGEHEEYDPEAKNDWGGKGKMVRVANDIRLNALSAMGDLRAKSSNRDPDQDESNTGTGPCCAPAPYAPYGKNPIYRKRGA